MWSYLYNAVSINSFINDVAFNINDILYASKMTSITLTQTIRWTYTGNIVRTILYFKFMISPIILNINMYYIHKRYKIIKQLLVGIQSLIISFHWLYVQYYYHSHYEY